MVFGSETARVRDLLTFSKNESSLLKRALRRCIRPFETLIVNHFHSIYYNGRVGERPIFTGTTWMGVPCLKCPLDMWVYQELIANVQPDLIIETGTYRGGTTLFLAHMLDILGKGMVLSVDTAPPPNMQHERIKFLTASSTDADVIQKAVKQHVHTNCLVILDSDHLRKHVLEEMELLHQYVSPGSYLIVEHTNINGHPTYRNHAEMGTRFIDAEGNFVRRNFGPGPFEAVEEFLKHHSDFVCDTSQEKHLMTFNPHGFLKRT
ncbi:MAG: CmcI family methyltransferase [Paracoccaceae bacterium]